MRLGPSLETFAIPIAALVAAMLLFGLFVALIGQSPLEVYRLIWQGGFASGFSCTLLLHFAHSLAQLFTPLRHRVSRNARKLNQCGLSFSVPS